MEHARLGFSHSDLWLTCAAWPRKVEGMGEEISPSIEFGNVSHLILEGMLLGEEVDPNVNSEEYECAEVTYNYVHERWEAMGYDNTQCLPESKVAITSTNREDLEGTPDVSLINPEIMEVIDHKTGAGTFVDETRSGQLKLGAIGVMETLKIQPPIIRLTIVQPRYWGSEEIIRTVETTPDELYQWLAMTAHPAAVATDDPNAPGTASDNCRKCVGRHVCEYRDQAVADALSPPAIGVNSTMDIEESVIRQSQDLVLYDNPRLSQVLMLVPVIRDYCDALEEHAKEVIMKGEHVPEFKVVETGGVPTWVGDREEIETKIRKSTIPNDDAFKTSLRTPKQVAALKAGAKRDKEQSASLKKFIADHTGRTDGGLVLVLESDSRESAAPVFNQIPRADPPVTEIPAALGGTPPANDPPAELPAFLQ